MVEKIYNLIKDKNFDAVLISNPHNMRYISGYTGDTGCLYISKNQKAIITDSRYTNQAIAQCKDAGYDILEIDNKGYSYQINKLIDGESVKMLGFEGNHLLYSQYTSYKEKLNCDDMITLGNELDLLRCIKNEEEIKNLTMAEKIGDIAFSKILDYIRPGVTEIEVAAHLEYYMKMEGACSLSFDTIVASGINSSMPHAGVSPKKIEKGDFVTMDFGCIYNGYCSDMTRTIVVGKADDRQKEIYNTVLKAQLAALDFIKSGVTGEQVDKVARDIIYGAGYEGCFGHGLGHSVGLEIHEEPRLSPSGKTVLQPGMIETVEPGIYIRDYGGVRIEDMVVVTENGHINLTHSSKELIELI